jgi:hypothetical protein
MLFEGSTHFVLHETYCRGSDRRQERPPACIKTAYCRDDECYLMFVDQVSQGLNFFHFSGRL